MTTSRHYAIDRQARERAIKKIGLGTILHEEVIYDDRKHRAFCYMITSTAILIVCDAIDHSYMITRYPARPSRIRKYWADAPEEIIERSIENTRKGLVF